MDFAKYLFKRFLKIMGISYFCTSLYLSMAAVSSANNILDYNILHVIIGALIFAGLALPVITMATIITIYMDLDHLRQRHDKEKDPK